ncbi:GTPase Era [Sodalis-like secondary symbiont of Drepanosiphum platanoidis]|uniref:GTPase Era n=1 Tax=Sodalis-like secondary symbiont of Drepanosiphum platanoidis TaxID=2994493 RepID=UPI0034649834
MNYCGNILIIGRSNVGKSTLINKIVGSKISITSKKPQTTYLNITGINTENKYQAIYTDTPGVYFYKNKIINFFNKDFYKNLLLSSKEEYVLVILVVEVNIWTNIEEKMFNSLKEINIKILIVINKIDILYKKNELLPYIKKISNKKNFISILPISAKNNINIDKLKSIVFNILPKKKHIFLKKNFIGNFTNKFFISEIIRENLINSLYKELPYNFYIEIEKLYEKNFIYVYANIIVNKINYKKIIIGKNGNKIKTIRKSSQKYLEKKFLKKFFLYIWVKIKI